MKLIGYLLFYPLYWIGDFCCKVGFGDAYQWFMYKSVQVSDYFNLKEWD